MPHDILYVIMQTKATRFTKLTLKKNGFIKTVKIFCGLSASTRIRCDCFPIGVKHIFCFIVASKCLCFCTYNLYTKYQPLNQNSIQNSRLSGPNEVSLYPPKKSHKHINHVLNTIYTITAKLPNLLAFYIHK